MTLHLLALETSSHVCDVVLLTYADGQTRVFSASHDQTGEHAERLLPLVDQVLSQAGIGRAQLDAVAFGQGPGGFTGLRVSCGVAQGMGFGLGVPVIPVPSLLAVAVRASQSSQVQSDHRDTCFLIMQDARMGEVYLAVYRPPQSAGQAWRTVQNPILIDASQVQPWLEAQVGMWGIGRDHSIYMAGDALDAYPDLAGMTNRVASLKSAGVWRADAQTVAHIAKLAWERGDVLSPEHAVPLYVRDKVAYTTSERQEGAGGNPRAPEHQVTIQSMTAEHLDAVATIESRVQSFPWTRQNFSDGLAAGYPGWVACQYGRVIGFYMVMMAPDVAHLLVIGVDPDYQGRGIGKQLVRHCQEQAHLNDLDTIVLEVRFSNHAAIGFYQQQGFKEFTVRKAYYPAAQGEREDASVMKKSWSPAKASE